MDRQLKKTFGLWFDEQIQKYFGKKIIFAKAIGYPTANIYKWLKDERIPNGYALSLIIETIAKQKSKQTNKEYEQCFADVSSEAIKCILGNNSV